MTRCEYVDRLYIHIFIYVDIYIYIVYQFRTKWNTRSNLCIWEGTRWSSFEFCGEWLISTSCFQLDSIQLWLDVVMIYHRLNISLNIFHRWISMGKYQVAVRSLLYLNRWPEQSLRGITHDSIAGFVTLIKMDIIIMPDSWKEGFVNRMIWRYFLLLRILKINWFLERSVLFGQWI